MKRIIILGATGSVGRTVLDVIAQHPDKYQVEALVAGRDVNGLVELARRFNPAFVALADTQSGSALREALSGTSIASGAGHDAVMDAAQRACDLVVAGIVGTAGLQPTFAAVRQGRTIALANKECLVSAGAAFMAGVRTYGAQILPLDLAPASRRVAIMADIVVDPLLKGRHIFAVDLLPYRRIIYFHALEFFAIEVGFR